MNERINKDKIQFVFSPKQTEARRLLDSPDVKELLYGGAKGGGKTMFGCMWAYLQALRLAQLRGSKRNRAALPVGFMGRQRSTDFTHTTLETFKQVVPSNLYTLRPGDKEIVIGGTVKILYGGMDDRDVINKFNSAEFGFVFVDQAEEISLDDAAMLRGTLRLKIEGTPIPSKILWTANPAECWLKHQFIEAPLPGFRYIQALPTDNPFLHPDYIDQLKSAFGHRQELLRAYLYGSWDSLIGSDQVIRAEWIRQAKDRMVVQSRDRSILACDPARFGDDETVIYQLHNTNIVDATIFGQKSTMYTANLLHIAAIQAKVEIIAVDPIGIGAGVCDRLREMSGGAYEVVEINTAEAALDNKLYVNRRAEIWDQAGKKFANGEIELDWDDPQLFRQLQAPTYRFRNGKIMIEPKENIKQRLGQSPDRADCYVLGLAALEMATGRLTERRSRNPYSWLSAYRRSSTATSAMAS